jgi:hypothetical protein
MNRTIVPCTIQSSQIGLASLLAVIAALAAPMRAQAATITWTDTTLNDQWSNTNNWSTHAEPTIIDDVIFPSTIPHPSSGFGFVNPPVCPNSRTP